jgi:sugar-specific transcriptional regulator TrmB
LLLLIVLERFGFTPTEDKVYKCLLQLGPSTGYLIAQELGIARANVYHSLESLVRRGASRKSSTKPVRYSAAGPSALVAEIDRSFRRDLTDLQESLQSLPLAGTGGSAELEMLTSVDKLLDRASSCADAAVSEVFAVTGPWADALNSRLAAAAARRVQVRAVSLSDPAPAFAVSRAVTEDQLRAYWGGLPVAVVADRGRAVAGVISSSGDSASGVATTSPGIIPFLRHMLRREVAGGS